MPPLAHRALPGARARAHARSRAPPAGFRIAKEQVDVTLGDVGVTGDIISVSVSGFSATIKNMQWNYKQKYFPYLKGSGAAEADMKGG